MTAAPTRDLVVDASTLVDLLVGSQTESIARAIRDFRWHAPAHVDVEVTSALRGLVLGGHLSPARAVDALIDFHDLAITRWPPDLPTSRRILALRAGLTAYDAAYVVCAEGLLAPLVTRDERLARAAAPYVEVMRAS
ncbi:MAG: type II toxin-antitoxin system VapC family toxin [Candidatus Phosphoribacter baldrii]|jgi:predicted nucleic acid-binding protein|nr:type II toxin-antitoxin system VapC family toxin [Candidatus Phosphoribacter baldrii]MBK6954009.1 type II toxin-antitoxin system VapC family toxin [Candidatus Phosphoribacter baldrii]MBP8882293.1 type II toxin-antitoxin system VapC family toxin [Dermatophilaceae bacterium]HRC18143.1 type II toxin-antitoxin system VapC family toxin [Phycicoccus elongatus]